MLVKTRLNSLDPTKKQYAEKGLYTLSKDSFYGPLVKDKLQNLISQKEEAKVVISMGEKHETAFTKSSLVAHPATQVGKENAKIFCELIFAIIKQAKENKVSAKIFEKFDNAYAGHQDKQGPQYNEIINELISNTQKTSHVKTVKKFINISEQTTPQSKTIVHAIKLYGAGDYKGAVDVLKDFYNYAKVPEIRAKEQIQPLQNVHRKE